MQTVLVMESDAGKKTVAHVEKFCAALYINQERKWN